MDENVDVFNSILLSVKKLVGIPQNDTSFDIDIIFHINDAASTLYQIGVLQEPYTVLSQDDTYDDLLPGGTKNVINQIKMYFVYKTKLGFDHNGLTGAVIALLEKKITELEWRLMVAFNPSDTFE